MVIGARAVMLRHMSGPLASASMIVDVTMEMIAQIAFVVTGLAILIVRVPGSPSSKALAETLAIGSCRGGWCRAVSARSAAKPCAA